MSGDPYYPGLFWSDVYGWQPRACHNDMMFNHICPFCWETMTLYHFTTHSQWICRAHPECETRANNTTAPYVDAQNTLGTLGETTEQIKAEKP